MMPTYIVYEIQEEVQYHKWIYEVEAKNAQAARDLVGSHDLPDPQDRGTYGEFQFGNSGWTVQSIDQEDSSHDANAWQTAHNHLMENHK